MQNYFSLHKKPLHIGEISDIILTGCKMEIGKRIKNRRISLGISVEDLAKKLGKNRATVYRYESDYIENLPVTILAPLAEALKCSPSYLMGWTDDPTPVDHGVKETVTHVIFDSEIGNMEVVRFPDAIMTDEGELLILKNLSDDGKKDIIKYIKFVLSQENK